MSTHPLIVALCVFAPSHPKMRIGIAGDGGYVALNLSNVVKYDHILSGGIGGDNSFEIHALDLNPGLTCDAYDHTINGLPKPDPRIIWHKTKVGPISEGGDPLTSYLDKYSNILAKIDIEQGEFAWLAGVNDKQLNSIAQLMIEWHALDFTTPHYQREMVRLSKTHKLVHVHVCNHPAIGSRIIGGVKVPHVIECTYVRKDLEPSTTLSAEFIPGPLDAPNVPGSPEISLNWPPFVNVKTEL